MRSYVKSISIVSLIPPLATLYKNVSDFLKYCFDNCKSELFFSS